MPWDNPRSKTLPPNWKHLRHQCIEQAGHQCTATLRNGLRCPETTNLEAHHPNPANHHHLICLCQWHHRQETNKQAAKARTPTTERKPSGKHPGLK